MNYIDLGLPDGTLWAEENSGGFCSFEEAYADFGLILPTEEQFATLIKNTKQYWDIQDPGVWFRSLVNGNAVFFPALRLPSAGAGPIGRGAACSYLSRTSRLLRHPGGYQRDYRDKKVRWVSLLNIHSLGVNIASRWLGGILGETSDNEFLCVRLCKER